MLVNVLLLPNYAKLVKYEEFLPLLINKGLVFLEVGLEIELYGIILLVYEFLIRLLAK